jgi:hypothetical protein
MQLQTGLRAGTEPAFVQAAAARNLQLLQAIESTLVRVESNTRLMDAVASDVSDVLALLQAANVSHALDPSGVVCKNFERAANIAASMYADARKRHQSAHDDFRLTSDDGVADAYDAYIGSIKGAHDAFEELREWIATHDDILEPSVGVVYNNVGDLMAALRG